MSDLLNKCEGCYQITLPECPEMIRVKVGLEADTEYYWFLVDKFQNKYYGKVTTDEDGNFDLDTSSLPVGLLNSFSGTFELFIKVKYNSCDNTLITICDETYECIQIQFEHVSGAQEDESGSGDGAAIITIPCEGCEGDPSMNLSIDVDCDTHEGTITVVAANLPNGTANAALQIYLDGDWQPTETIADIVNGTNTFPPSPFDLGNGTYQLRAVAGDIVSNVFELVVDCGEPQIILNGFSRLCDELFPAISVDFELINFPTDVNVRVHINNSSDVNEYTNDLDGNLRGNGVYTGVSGGNVFLPSGDGDYTVFIFVEGYAESNTIVLTVDCEPDGYSLSYLSGVESTVVFELDLQVVTKASDYFSRRSLRVLNVTDNVTLHSIDSNDDPASPFVNHHLTGFVADKEYYIVSENECVNGLISITTMLIKFNNVGLVSALTVAGIDGGPDNPMNPTAVDMTFTGGPLNGDYSAINFLEVNGVSSVNYNYEWASENPPPTIQFLNYLKPYNSWEFAVMTLQEDISAEFPAFCALQPSPYLISIANVKEV